MFRPSLLLILLTVILCLLLLFRTSDQPTPEPEHDPEHAFSHQIIAVGDLHGSLATAKRVLRMAGVIDRADEWILGKGTLVQTGDIVDRGHDTIELYRFMEDLRASAITHGGSFFSLLGNHEIMNALGDWRYVTKDDIDTYGGLQKRREALSPRGELGKMWLANYSLTAKVPLHPLQAYASSPLAPPAISFIHAGLPTDASNLTPYPMALNDLTRSLLWKALDEQAKPSPPFPYPGLPKALTDDEAMLWGADGVLWYRGYATDPEAVACANARKVMDRIKVRRLVMGHTPNFEGIVSRCQGAILLIDTGISPAYSGTLSALSIRTTLSRRTGLQRRYPPGKEREMAIEGGEGSWVEKEVVEAIELPDRESPEGNESEEAKRRVLWKASTPFVSSSLV